MKNNCRNFIKIAGLTSFGIASGALTGCATMSGDNSAKNLPTNYKQIEKSHTQRYNMSGYAAPKLSTVRIGIIGMGNRGPGHMLTWTYVNYEPYRRG